MTAWIVTPSSAPNGPSSETSTNANGIPTTNPARAVTGTTAASTRNGEGPTYGRTPRARRSMPCDPAPAIRPTASGINPTTRRIRDVVVPPDRSAMLTMARPASVAIQPTTNSPGADRPSMVKVELPGRAGSGGGTPASSDPGSGGGSDGFNAPAADPAGSSAAGRSPVGRGLNCGPRTG